MHKFIYIDFNDVFTEKNDRVISEYELAYK